MVTEVAYGQLKGRWRVLLRKSESNKEHVRMVTLACTVLGNICIDQGDSISRKLDLTVDPSAQEKRDHDEKTHGWKGDGKSLSALNQETTPTLTNFHCSFQMASSYSLRCFLYNPLSHESSYKIQRKIRIATRKKVNHNIHVHCSDCCTFDICQQNLI